MWYATQAARLYRTSTDRAGKAHVALLKRTMSVIGVTHTKKADFIHRAGLKPLLDHSLSSVKAHILAVGT